MRSRYPARLVLSLSVLAVVAGLATVARPAEAQAGPTFTVGLQPGWNLAGWVEPEASVQHLFDTIPRAEAVFAWDAKEQRFQGAYADPSLNAQADLQELNPGMGLWIWLGGTDRFAWKRPPPPNPSASALHLREGWNLVTWMGLDGVTAEHALAPLGSDLTVAMSREALTGQFLQYSAADPGASTLGPFRRGHTLWVSMAADKEWEQAVALEPTVEFHGAVSEPLRAEALASAHDVVRYFADRYGTYLSDTTFHFTANDALFKEVTAQVLGEAPTWNCQQYGEGAIFWDLSCDVSALDPQGLDGAGLDWAYFFALLKHLGTTTTREPWGWTLSGWQRYEWLLYQDSLHAESPTSHRSYEAAIKEFQTRVGWMHYPVERPLHRLGPKSIDLEILGVDWVTRQAGTYSLYEYHQALVRGERWEDAFTQAFGLTPDMFYDEFESYIGTIVVPQWDLYGYIRDSNGRHADKWYFIITAHALAEGEGVRYSGLVGEFNFHLPVGYYQLEFIALCNYQHIFLGWYDGDGSLVRERAKAGQVFMEGGDVSVDVRLPSLPPEVSPLCELEPRRAISGVVTGPDGHPTRGLWVSASPIDRSTRRDWPRGVVPGDSTTTAEDGTFSLSVLDSITFWIQFASLGCEGADPLFFGIYDSVTGVTDWDASQRESTHVVVDGEDVTDIHVRLPEEAFLPEMGYDEHLRRVQQCPPFKETVSD